MGLKRLIENVPEMWRDGQSAPETDRIVADAVFLRLTFGTVALRDGGHTFLRLAVGTVALRNCG